MYTIFILEQDTFLTQPIPYKVYIAWFPPMKTSPNTFSRALRSLPLQFPTQGRVGGGERWTISEAMYTSAFCTSLGIFLRTFWCAGHWGVRWKKDFAFYNYRNLHLIKLDGCPFEYRFTLYMLITNLALTLFC